MNRYYENNGGIDRHLKIQPIFADFALFAVKKSYTAKDAKSAKYRTIIISIIE